MWFQSVIVIIIIIIIVVCFSLIQFKSELISLISCVSFLLISVVIVDAVVVDVYNFEDLAAYNEFNSDFLGLDL